VHAALRLHDDIVGKTQVKPVVKRRYYRY